jgi:DNA mismatch repair protein MutS
MKEEVNIVTEYIHLNNEYRLKYGEKCFVLYLVGVFYEFYSLKNTKTGEINKNPPIELYSQMCSLNIAEKKCVMGDYTCVISGFRDYVLEKYLQIITSNGYTAVIYNQEKKGNVIKRVFHSVVSSGTFIPYDNDLRITNNIMCIWIENYKIHGVNKLIIGYSIVNILTGYSTIYEYETDFLLNPTTFDQLEKNISINVPNEIIIISSLDDEIINTIIQYSGISESQLHKISSINNIKAKNCIKQHYIKQLLSNVFGNEVFDICIEFNEHIIATQSFCYLIDFLQEHNIHIVRKINIPILNNVTNKVLLANHTLKQLNIIDDLSSGSKTAGHLSSVLSFMNKCSTSIGKRLFQRLLLNPTYDEEWLKKEYNIIDFVLKKNIDIDNIRTKLSTIKDIETISRKIVISKIYPSSFYNLYSSINTIQEIINSETIDFWHYFEHNNEELNKKCNIINENINKTLYIDFCKYLNSTRNFEKSIIKEGVSKSLDDILFKYNYQLDSFEKIKKHLNDLLNETYIKTHETDKSGVSLQITKKRGDVLKDLLNKKLDNFIQINDIKLYYKDIKLVNSTSSNVEIDSVIIYKICKDLLYLKEKISENNEIIFNEFLSDFENKCYNHIEDLSRFISKFDVLITKCYISNKYKYCSPTICDNKTSYLEAYDIRHLLIEHINLNEIYVTNDVILKDNGIILYGVNTSGKTSLIRAIGICVILAQSGMYVPCSTFLYKPYKSIFSRILSNDNLFKNLSSFSVEISELRVILNCADENSLVLSDELCSSTEHLSALSILSSTLIHLTHKRSSFIFSTHYNEILEFDEIKNITNLNVLHLEVFYDIEQKSLIFDRKLKKGCGSMCYGLEIAKSLYLNNDFINSCFTIRNKYFNNNESILSNNVSTYSSKKIKGICELCKIKKSNDVHHILPQRDADKNGFITHFHKNHPANLMNLCENCHIKTHKNENNSVAIVIKKKRILTK